MIACTVQNMIRVKDIISHTRSGFTMFYPYELILSHMPVPALGKDKQEGQEALNRSPEFCLKLTCRYMLKAGHVPPGEGANFGPWHHLNKFGRGLPGHAIYQISRL